MDRDMPIGTKTIRVTERDYGYGKNIYIGIDNERTEKSHIGKLVFEEWVHGEIAEPTFVISRKDERTGNDPLYKLMDNLWGMGYRPSDKVDHLRNDEITAISNHLKDMRNIVFKKYMNIEVT